MFVNVGDNLVALAEVWAHFSSGYLRLRPHMGRARGEVRVEVQHGGLVRASDWSVVFRALADHSFSFEQALVSGRGDRRALGSVLSLAGRRHGVDVDRLIRERGGVRPQKAVGAELLLLPGVALNFDFNLLSRGCGLGERQNVLLAQGIGHVTAGRWEAADDVLSHARNQRFDSPRVLAWLAWARQNNPTRALAERSQDALALIQVAEQLAPEDAEVGARAKAIRQAQREASSQLRGMASASQAS